MHIRIIDKCLDMCSFNFRLAAEHIFNLLAFDTPALNHHLKVLSAQEGDIAIRQLIAKVSRTVYAAPVGSAGEIALLGYISQIPEAYSFA